MTTSARRIGHSVHANSNQIKRTKVGFAVAAAASLSMLAAAYGVRRIFVKRNSGFCKYKRRFEDWIVPRLETTLQTTSEIASQIASEVRAASQVALYLNQTFKKVEPKKRDLLEIGLDKRLLKMKKRIHQMLDITEAPQASALYEFYQELRQWLIPDTKERENASLQT